MSPEDRRVTERWVATAFGVTVLGAIGFGAVYALGGQVQLEGAFLGLAFVGLAVGFAAWTGLLPPGPYAEEREPMVPPRQEREAAEREWREDEEPLTRTSLPRRALAMAVGSLAVVAAFPLRSLVRGEGPAEALTTTPWGEGVNLVTQDGERVRPEDLDTGTALTVFPQGHVELGNDSVLLIRVDPDLLRLPPVRQGWTVSGLVAYSKICTHAGCPVGLYADQVHELLCPCHQSVFNVLEGAVPTFGPATRALPQLPIALDPEGFLVATGDFPEPVGPGFWRKT